MSVFSVPWILAGWFFLLIAIKGHGGLSNMLAGGVGDARENDVVSSSASESEKDSALRQISREVEFQRTTGVSLMVRVLYLSCLATVYGFFGPFSVLWLAGLPAGADVWGFKF